MERLAKEGDLENEVLIAGLILLERYLRSLRVLCPIHFYKLVAVSCYLAQKVVLDEEIWSLPDYGHIAGLSAEKLKFIESEFLNQLDFGVHITEEEFMLYKGSLI